MNKVEFKQYIDENFNISGEASRLITNILDFVETNYPYDEVQYKVLCSLLDGTIGLTDSELKKVYL